MIKVIKIRKISPRDAERQKKIELVTEMDIKKIKKYNFKALKSLQKKSFNFSDLALGLIVFMMK